MGIENSPREHGKMWFPGPPSSVIATSLLTVPVLPDLGDGTSLLLPPCLQSGPTARLFPPSELPNAHLTITSPRRSCMAPDGCMAMSECLRSGLVVCLHPPPQPHVQLSLSVPFHSPMSPGPCFPHYTSNETSPLPSGPAGLCIRPVNTRPTCTALRFSCFSSSGPWDRSPEPGTVFSKGWLVAYRHEYIFGVRLHHPPMCRSEDKRPSGGS